jgi:bacillopeptidase F
LALLASAVLVGAHSSPDRVDRPLRDAISRAAAGEYVGVLIRLESRVDLGAHRSGDLRTRRARLVRALRAHAVRTQPSLRARLVSARGRELRELWLINALAARVPAGSVSSLAAHPGVASVSLDAIVTLPEPLPASGGGGSGGSPAEWNLLAIGAPDLWSLGFDGSGVVVATLDSGADLLHPDLGPRWRGGTNSWFDPYGQHAGPYDASGHGTWSLGLLVGGEAGGSSIGVAPGAAWIAAKIFQDNGQATLSGIHLAFQWILDPDGNPASNDAPDVVASPWFLEGTEGSCDAEFAGDIAALGTAGIPVVFAAGNSGPGSSTSVSPGNDVNSIAVGATDAFGFVAGFSSRGPSACGGGLYPSLVAPGVDVRTSDLTFGGVFPNSYLWVNGTSFATSHVAGALALLKDAFPQATAAQLRMALEATAGDLGAPGPDPEAGAGLPDLSAAHQWLQSQLPPDADLDGFAAGVDCNDGDASIHPGAPETKHDSVDQDCNGWDLTIDVIRAPYSVRLDKLEVQATSAQAGQADLSVTVHLESGASFQTPLVWNSKLEYWQRMIDFPKLNYGTEPVSVEVSGVEGSESFPVLRR